LTREQVEDESGTGSGTKFDEDNLGNFGTRSGDTEHHPLTEAGLEAGAEKNNIRNAGRFYGHHRSPRDRPDRLDLGGCAIRRSEKQHRKYNSDPEDHEGLGAT
jgi:hypothetical protein